jgi:protein-S-isoprenylcysteine O-methyltransferase Ste14
MPSTAASPQVPSSRSVARRLARLRVPLGFAFGVTVLLLARPTWWTLLFGGLVAVLGESLRVWAAGHVQKGREVTTSGPYRWLGHPLYLGSTVIGVGLIVASASLVVAVLVAAYLSVTMTAAIRSEEADLRARFGDEYAAYREGRAAPLVRAFSVARAWRNHEQRTVAGLLAGWGLLALKVAFGL